MAPPTSAKEDFVQTELLYERALEFLPDERQCIVDVLAILRETNEEHCFHSLSKERQRCVIRGMRFRKHWAQDVAQAAKDIYNFRISNDMDNSLSKIWENHEVFYDGWPSYVCGSDDTGHWVNYESVGDFKVNNLDIMDQHTTVMLRCQYYEAQAEMKRRLSRRLGRRVVHFVYLFDLKDLSITKHFTPKVKRTIQPLLDVCGQMYPDILWSMYIINAPMSFRFIWRIVMPWVDPDIRSRVRILGGSSQYLKAMQADGIPLEALPKEVGGTCDMVHMRDVVEDLVSNWIPETKTFKNDHEDFIRMKIDPELNHTEDILSDEYYNNVVAKDDEFAKRVAAEAAALMAARQQDEEDEETKEEGNKEPSQLEFDEEEVLMEGWLSKRGAVNTAWKQRYFVLTPQKLLYYTSNPREKDAALRGSIELYLVSKVQRAPFVSDLASDRESRLWRQRNKNKDARARAMTMINTKQAPDEFSLVTPYRTWTLKLEMDFVNSKYYSGSSRILPNRPSLDDRSSRKFASVAGDKLAKQNSVAVSVASSSRGVPGKDAEDIPLNIKPALTKQNSAFDDGVPIKEKMAEREYIILDWIREISAAAAEESCSLEFGGEAGSELNQVKSGYLMQKGPSNIMFSRYFFVLTTNGLYYFSGEPSDPKSVLRGKVWLHMILKIDPVGPGVRFNIVTKQRVLQIKAANEVEKDDWINVITSASEKDKQRWADLKEEQKKSFQQREKLHRTATNAPGNEGGAEGLDLDEAIINEARENFGESITNLQLLSNLKGLMKTAIDFAASLNILVDRKGENIGAQVREADGEVEETAELREILDNTNAQLSTTLSAMHYDK